jgi:tetratricopeptide (TPR) repeat protein
MTLPRTPFTLLLLGTLCFTLALLVQPRVESWPSDRTGGLLPLLLGDGRRLFANHFFVKADAYFHRGVYPGLFDRPLDEDPHISGPDPDHDHAHDLDDHDHHHDHEHWNTEPADWIAKLHHRLSPTDHVHLDGHEAREMLPWLRLAVELDPNNLQAYVVTTYWLRDRLGRVDEAEQFLREGLRHNPGNPDLLFELGVLFLKSRQDPDRARNLLELGLARWEQEYAQSDSPNLLLKQGFLMRLANLEAEAGELQRALDHLEQLLPLSPNPEAVEEQIRELKAKVDPSPRPPAAP